MLEIYVEAVGNSAFGVVCKGEAVLASNFGVEKGEVLKSFNRMFSKESFHVAAKPSAFAKNSVSVLKSIYEGKGANEELPLSLERFPTYTQRVLRAVARIPVGYVASYGGVAEAIGGGARAVGNVMATNCFAPIVPCHRVVTSNLGLGGYGGAGSCGGLRVKYEFLKREKRSYTKPQDISVEGGLLRVYPVEFVLSKLEKPAAQRKL